MVTVRLIPDWPWTDENHLMKQTPNRDGIWDNIKFTLDDIDECDYLIVFNKVFSDIKISCPEGNKWLISAEPPVSMFAIHTSCYSYFDRLFLQDQSFQLDERVTLTHGALPWFLEKDYKQLNGLKPGKKDLELSIVLSNAKILEGHRLRNNFFERLKKSKLKFDAFGKGVNFVEDKFDALYPYKYSIALENSAFPHYWTEKIADCFLSWTMPIYFGAPNITDYFPQEAMILIDLNQPEEALEIIQKAMSEKAWEKNIDAIGYARDKVLNEYQLFPFLANQINLKPTEARSNRDFFIPKTTIHSQGNKSKMSLRRIKNRIKRILP